MTELSTEAVERLVLLLATYSKAVNEATVGVAPDPDLLSNVSLVVLCTLDLDGPRRPGLLQEVTGLSSGGVSKLLDRMEQAGLVKRTYRGVPGDNRGVLVSITRRGRTLTSRMCGAVAARLPEPRTLVKEISTVLDA